MTWMTGFVTFTLKTNILLCADWPHYKPKSKAILCSKWSQLCQRQSMNFHCCVPEQATKIKLFVLDRTSV